MALTPTSLLVQMSPLSPVFKGSPQDLATEMIRRMKILSPSGTNFIFIGDTAPSSNVGPWLKDGTKWYVWDEATKQYVPLDVTDSVAKSYWLGNALPTATTPPLWLKTTQNPTDQNPTAYGESIGWYFWDGTQWTGLGNIVLAGPTSSRPSAPDNYQQFYDSTISTLIWWERGSWRTVDGVPGDVKFVLAGALSDALTQNPGWDYIGRNNPTWRGRALVIASQDPGATPVAVFPPSGVVPAAASQTTGGDSQNVQGSTTSTVTSTPFLALWALYKQ
jgi:hypothetical protein